MRDQNLRDELTRLVELAERQSGRVGLTTHEAQEHFRRTGNAPTAQELHLLLCKLASGRAEALVQDLASAMK